MQVNWSAPRRKGERAHSKARARARKAEHLELSGQLPALTVRQPRVPAAKPPPLPQEGY